MKKDRYESGYTLLELMIALAIFTSVMVVAGMGLSMVQQTWRKNHFHNQRLESMLKIDRVVDSCFRNIIPFHWPDKANADKAVFNGDRDSITFAYMHRITKTNYSAIRFIKLFLENDGSLIAEYRKSPIIPDEDVGHNIEREVLAEGVETISFSYAHLNESGTMDWRDDWDEDQNDLNKIYMPMAIQLTLEWGNGRIETWLRRTAGSGVIESLGKIQK